MASDFSVYNNIQRPFAPVLPSKENESGSSFGALLKDAINEVNQLEKQSGGELQNFLSEKSDLHSVLIALEKADLSFQVMMQVRNKIVQAYQEIMRTQV